MIRGERIKEAIFAAFTVNGSVLSPVYNSINGEILKITFTNVSSPGSLWVAESGTDVEFWRRNNVTSGLASFEVYPKVQITDSTNTTLDQSSGNTWTERVTLGPIYIAASGLTSGTSTTFGPIIISYR